MLPSSLPSLSTLSSSSAAASTTTTALTSFIYAIKSPESQRLYLLRLRQFFDFLGLSGSLEKQAEVFLQKAKDNGAQWTQENIISFINYHKQRVQRKEITAGTLNNTYYVVKLFCEMNNDLVMGINWKRISRGLPSMKPTANDRSPTIEEIRTLVEYPDRRIKAIVYTMCSSGIRLGARQYLRWKHVTPLTNNKDKGEIIAAKVIVYAGEPEEYYTFITPEAYNAVKGWMDFRASHGEKIHGDSWVMRDLWQMSDVI